MEHGIDGASAGTASSGVQVECRSEFIYAERPLAFWWPVDQKIRLVIERVEAQWRSPEGVGFRVTVQGGQRFELLYEELTDRWTARPL